MVPPPPPAPEEGVVDLQEQPLGRILPGTRVEETAPEGWSHIVYVAKPRIGDRDLKKVSKTVAYYASLFTVNCLANVAAWRHGDTTRYGLDQVAIGIGTDIQGTNTIINSATHRELRADLDLLACQLLSHCEADFKGGFTQIARTPRLLVYDSNAVLLIKGEHRTMITRSAILVSPETGQLRTFLWLFDEDYQLSEEPMQCLPPFLQEDRVMSVNPDKFFLGLPRDGAFAQLGIAQGTPIPWTDALRNLADAKRLTKTTALELEQQLLRLMNQIIADE